MASVLQNQTNIALEGLPTHANFFPGLNEASFSPTQLRSIQLMEKAIQGLVRNPRSRRLTAYLMYDILHDFRPRRLLSRGGETRAVIIPLSDTVPDDGVTVVFSKKNSRGVEVCDVSIPENSGYRAREQSYAAWTNTIVAQIGEAYKYKLLRSLPTPLGIHLQIHERHDSDLHSLYFSKRLSSVIAFEFRERMANHFKWAHVLGTGISDSTAIFEPSSFMRLLTALQKLAGEQIRGELDHLIRPLAPHVLESLSTSTQCYTGDIEKAVRASTTILQTKRARWLASFPLYRSLANKPHVLSRIDNDEQTIAQLSKEIGVPRACISRLRELPASILADAGGLDPVRFTQLCSQVNINHLPQYRKASLNEIRAFSSTVARVRRLLDVDEDTPLGTTVAQHLLRNAKGRWLEQTKHSADDHVQHASDFIRIFAKRTVLAALLREEPVECAFVRAKEAGDRVARFSSLLLVAGLSGQWNLGDILKASADWHAIVGKHGFTEELQMWPALCESLIAPNGVQLIPLTSSAELVEEGKLMHHCVGGYASQCRSGKNHIFSIRDPESNRLSTLQLRQGNCSVAIAQNLAFANRLPALEAREAASWLVEQVNSGDLQIPWDSLVAKQKQLQRTTTASTILGFDPLNEELWNKAFSEFKGFCPGSLRAGSAQQFIQALVKEVKRQNIELDKTEGKLLRLLEGSPQNSIRSATTKLQKRHPER
jgi:hypothetical protein